MTAFKDFSITNKIRVIVMIISTIALIMACGFLGVLEVINFRSSQVDELSILSQIIADRSTASLAFADPRTAHETLNALKAKESIISACILDGSGEIFATYFRPGGPSDPLPQDLESQETGFHARALHVVTPILLEGEKIGTVFIKSDLSQMYSLVWKYTGYVALALCFAILAAFFMLAKLQRFISKPILDLANIAGLTAIHMDFSTRAQKTGNDEIGLLVDAFNSMMDLVKHRDLALMESKNRAEAAAQKARDLAAETSQMNLKLQKEIAERKRIYNALHQSETKLKDAYRQLETRVAERTAELREANRELRKAIQAADEAANAKNEFLANMSHEIRTPMNGVISAAELALSENIPLSVEHYLKIIHGSGNALLAVINDILDFSKIDSGNLMLTHQDFRVDGVLQNAIMIFSSVAAEKNIELLLDIQPETPLDLIGDPLRYQQVLTNLIGNAVKFTDRDGVVLIELSAENIDANTILLTCSVKDTGIGMQPQQREKLFQAFTQADTSITRKFGGTGLGLSISHQIVKLMNGQIFVESEFGEGSKFTFTAVMTLPAHQTARPYILPENLKGLDVLLVDDNRESLKILDGLITRFGFNAQSADSGEAALLLLTQMQQTGKIPDLAVIDMRMTGMDGLETARAIRRDADLDFPIILMTTGFADFMVTGPENPSIEGFVTKPVTASALLNTIMDAFAEKHGKKPMGDTPEALQGKNGSRRLSGAKILVVDDNRVNQEIAMEILKSADIIVRTASDGAEAVRAVLQETYDAVLMDIHMPTMDGYEAVRKIREVKKLAALPIIAMTASDIMQDESRCLAAGMNGFIPKPIRPKILFETLGQFLRPRDEFPESKNIPAAEALRTIDNDWPKAGDETKTPPETVDFRQAAKDLNLEMDVYKKILSRFFTQNIHTMDRLRTAATQGQWKQLQSLAHNLKGSSGNIGAEAVKQSAEKIENFCRNGAIDPADTEKIHRLLDDFDPLFTRLLASIKTVVQPEPTFSTEKTPSVQDLSQIKPELARLMKVLETADPMAIKTSLARLKQHWNGSSLQSIEVKINEYEYDEARAMLTHTIRQMKTAIREEN